MAKAAGTSGGTKLGARLIEAMGEVRKWAAGKRSGVKVSKLAGPPGKGRRRSG